MSDRPDSPHDDANDPAAPDQLVEALRALSPRPPEVPTAVDAAILERARAQLLDRLRPADRSTFAGTGDVRTRPSTADPSAGPRLIPFPRWLAAAAALALGIGLVALLRREGADTPSLVREDIDRNGRVDILDAFALARKLQSSAVSEAAFDMNGDGTIDQRDIDWIAARAVRLQKG